MASVRKRKWTHKGPEKEAWVVAYTNQGGTRRIKTFEKKKDADRYRVKVEEELSRGAHVVLNDSARVSEAIDLYLRHCDRRVKMGEIVKGTYVGIVKAMNFISARMGGKRFVETTFHDFERLIEDMRVEGYKANTV